jgi:predicted DsbA family dithiol-disulfide isomerase
MQTAAKCAERQGVSAFESFHQRLCMAHFHDNLDISRQDVLWRLPHNGKLDVPRFQQDYTNGEAYQAVLHDYAEGVAWFGVSALPTVVFNESLTSSSIRAHPLGICLLILAKCYTLPSHPRPNPSPSTGRAG